MHTRALAQVHKLLCIVQLLTGEIPERSVFRQPALQRSLRPYFQLTQVRTVPSLHQKRALCCALFLPVCCNSNRRPRVLQAVRIGDLSLFSSVLEKFRAIFSKDETYTLIIRYGNSCCGTF